MLAVCSYNTPGFAQVKNLLYKEPVYTQVDKYPVYTGGFEALHDFLNKNLKSFALDPKPFLHGTGELL